MTTAGDENKTAEESKLFFCMCSQIVLHGGNLKNSGVKTDQRNIENILALH